MKGNKYNEYNNLSSFYSSVFGYYVKYFLLIFIFQRERTVSARNDNNPSTPRNGGSRNDNNHSTPRNGDPEDKTEEHSEEKMRTLWVGGISEKVNIKVFV